MTSVVAVAASGSKENDMWSSSRVVLDSLHVTRMERVRCELYAARCEKCTLKKILFARQNNSCHLRAKRQRVMTPISRTAFRLLSKTHSLFDLTASEKSNCFSDL